MADETLTNEQLTALVLHLAERVLHLEGAVRAYGSRIEPRARLEVDLDALKAIGTGTAARHLAKRLKDAGWDSDQADELVDRLRESLPEATEPEE